MVCVVDIVIFDQPTVERVCFLARHFTDPSFGRQGHAGEINNARLARAALQRFDHLALHSLGEILVAL